MNRWHVALAVFAALIAAVAMLVLARGQQGAAPAHAQQPGLVELSFNVAPAANHCTPEQKPDTCTFTHRTRFILTVDMNAFPPGGYSVYDLQVLHPSLRSTSVRHVAPGFASSAVEGIGTTSFLAGAITSLAFPLPKSTHLGPLVEAYFSCMKPGVFKIDLPVPFTGVKDQNNQAIPITTVLADGVKVADTLTINCGGPVGGIAELPEVVGTPLETGGSSGSSAGVLAGAIAGAVLVGGITLGGAAWWARRRRWGRHG